MNEIEYEVRILLKCTYIIVETFSTRNNYTGITILRVTNETQYKNIHQFTSYLNVAIKWSKNECEMK